MSEDGKPAGPTLSKTLSLASDTKSLSITDYRPQLWYHQASTTLLQDSITFAPPGAHRERWRVALCVLAVLAVCAITAGKYVATPDLQSPTMVNREFASDTPITLDDVTIRLGQCPSSVQFVPLSAFAQIEGNWIQQAITNLTNTYVAQPEGADAIAMFTNTVGSQFTSFLLRYFQQQLDSRLPGGQTIYTSNLQTVVQLASAFASFTRDGILVQVNSWFTAFAALQLVLNANTIQLISSLAGPTGPEAFAGNETEAAMAMQTLEALSATMPIFGGAASAGYEAIDAFSSDILSLQTANASASPSMQATTNVQAAGDPFEVIIQSFYDSITIDWQAYRDMCDPQYCDYVTKKSAGEFTSEFLATLGGPPLLLSSGMWAAQCLLPSQPPLSGRRGSW